MSQIVLSYDLGGTKVAVGAVNSRGRVLAEIRVPVALEKGKAAVLTQLADLGKKLLAKYPEIKRVGMASAGPLDPKNGILLDPTNFTSSQGSWGKVPIASILKEKLKRPVFLENDAAAAILAERWVGAGKGYNNLMVLTLGTGLGTGVIANGELVRAGRNLHTEAGHMILKFDDTTAPCGCGNLGCAEAYLSGRNFGRRAQQRFADADLTAKDIADLARRGDPRALAAFEEYAEIMAVAITTYAKIYSPELIILTGSFAEASDLFLANTRKHLAKKLARGKKTINLVPKLVISTLDNEAGIIGGAYVALNS
jgi:glucokinase